MKKDNSSKIIDIIIYIIITIISLCCLIPFLHVFSLSVSSNSAVMSQKVYIFPVEFTIEAYRQVLGDASMIRSLLTTIYVTVLFTAIGMILTICAAYPLSRKRLKGRYLLSFIFLFTMYFHAGIIPDYLLMNRLGLINSLWSLILPLAFSTYNMIIMRSFIQNTIPDSLEESAFLEGCTDIGVLIRIVIPLCKPVLATLCLFYAVGRWNAYQDSLYYITKQNLYVLQHKLSLLISTASDSTSLAQDVHATQVLTPEVLKAACIMFATIPIVIVYPFLQKYFVKGIMIGAVKG
ncbi:MAG: carbohydrate ABC transporter permease [Epulopiscium sp.]|nr:carbohydrate ABC transporter permease [Candidatus Epulonipiscium sp.]